MIPAALEFRQFTRNFIGYLVPTAHFCYPVAYSFDLRLAPLHELLIDLLFSLVDPIPVFVENPLDLLLEVGGLALDLL